MVFPVYGFPALSCCHGNTLTKKKSDLLFFGIKRFLNLHTDTGHAKVRKSEKRSFSKNDYFRLQQFKTNQGILNFLLFFGGGGVFCSTYKQIEITHNSLAPNNFQKHLLPVSSNEIFPFYKSCKEKYQYSNEYSSRNNKMCYITVILIRVY